MNEITVRRLNIDFAGGFPRYWHGGDPFRTLLWNSLSMSLPAGEMFFIDTVREFSDVYQTDLQLQKDVEGFALQEANHRWVHRLYNDQIAKHGFHNLLDARIRRRVFGSTKFHRLSRLSLVIADEHITAVAADTTMRFDAYLEGVQADIADFWRWHAAEEIEHKSVAFDLYQLAGGGYFRRIWGFFVGGSYVLGDVISQTVYCLRQDRLLYSWSTWKSAARYLLARNGLIWHVVPHWLAYLSPWFHPARRNNQALIAHWFSENEKRFFVVPRRKDKSAS